MDRISIKHYCACNDRPYTVTYQRKGNRFASVKVVTSTPKPPGFLVALLTPKAAPTTASSPKINAQLLDCPDCPYCGSSSVVFCNHGYAICGGLSSEGRFVCRQSCGQSGGLTRAGEVGCEKVSQVFASKPAAIVPEARQITYRK